MLKGTTIAAVLVLCGAGVAAADIPWETKWDRAAAVAARSNQPVFIEFSAVWCEVCEGMDENVYADERVITAMRKVLPVRIDIDRDKVLARKYEVSGTPTLVLSDAYGNELFRFTGDLTLPTMLKLLDELPSDISAINGYAARLKKNKKDVEALAGMERELRDKGFFVAADRYAERLKRVR